MTARAGWLTRLKTGLSRSSNRLSEGIAGILTGRRLDAATVDELEELLIIADFGVAAAAEITGRLAKARHDASITEEELRGALADEVAAILEPVARPLAIDPAHKPFVVLVVGVNGTGKTTTIGKLAHLYRQDGQRVLLAAGDTFRAAAIDQLKVWGERAGAKVVAGEPGADAAALAFDALGRAHSEGADLLLIDTAGRLQNKADLMGQLEKMVRVVRKRDAGAPHAVLLVLDATTGQNAIQQVEVFREVSEVTGLVMTKLDGTARGGVLIAIAERFGLPVHAIGVGEGIDDLRPFEARAFARALVGLED